MGYPNDPNQPGGYPPQGGYPSQQAHRHAPPAGYGYPPYSQVPPYGAPRKSRAVLWIILAMVAMPVLFLGYHYLLVDNSWKSSPSSYAGGTSGSSSSSSPLVGRWCNRGGQTQFNANGTLTDSSGGGGSWQELSGSRINMTAGSQNIAATYSVTGNRLTMTLLSGESVTYTRC